LRIKWLKGGRRGINFSSEKEALLRVYSRDVTHCANRRDSPMGRGVSFHGDRLAEGRVVEGSRSGDMRQ